MRSFSIAIALSIGILISFNSSILAQKKLPAELNAQLQADEKFVAECEQKIRRDQLAKFGRVKPKIAGDCWEGECAVRVVKPYYSEQARRLNIRGQMKVETIVDEKGDVIYARVIKGLPLMEKAALDAAYASKYSSKKACDKAIKFRWIITYNIGVRRQQINRAAHLQVEKASLKA